MKNSSFVKWLTEILILLLAIHTILSAFPPHPLTASVYAAEQSSPVPEEAEALSPGDEEEEKEPPVSEGGEEGKEPPVSEGGEEGEEPPVSEDGKEEKEPPSSEGGEEEKEPPVSEGGEEGKEPPVSEGGEEGEEPLSSEGGEEGKEPPVSEGGEDGKEPTSTAPLATPSDAAADQETEGIQPSLAFAAMPLIATPSDAVQEIVFMDVPDLVALESGEVDNNTWEKVFPLQVSARTESGNDIWCHLNWYVGDVSFDQPGLYPARLEIVPPSGYILGDLDVSHNAVVSIHPPGTSQVMDVFASMRHGMKGHTWTFAMKAGQDMTPLVDILEDMNKYTGMLDDPKEEVFFSAEWDFFAVKPDKPGIYPIYRSLTLIEDGLPEGVNPDEIYLPDYWKNLPVLLSVEGTEGPRLYGVLESPYDFFGSYAKLSEEELDILEVWYSIDGGKWTLQTDEGLMETYESHFSINKDEMKERRSYSFRLELGDHVSETLTVRKDGTSPIWFSCTIDGSRDGTIEVEFPTVSQPPPENPPDSVPVYPDPGGFAGGSSHSDSDGSGNYGTTESTGSQENHAGKNTDAYQTDPVSADLESGLPPYAHIAEDAGTRQTAAVGVGRGSGTRSGRLDGESESGSGRRDVSSETGTASRDSVSGTRPEGQSNSPDAGFYLGSGTDQSKEAAVTDSIITMEPDRDSGFQQLPEEAVTRWTTQISGIRARKLIELYPDWIRFQKEGVSVLLSSQWLRGQHMRDSDVLTVSVSPGEDHTVTILINQKEPKTPPVFQVTIEKNRSSRVTGAVSAAAVLAVILAGVLTVFWQRRRWEN